MPLLPGVRQCGFGACAVDFLQRHLNAVSDCPFFHIHCGWVVSGVVTWPYVSSCVGTCPHGHSLWSGPRSVWSRSLLLWSLLLWSQILLDIFSLSCSLSRSLSPHPCSPSLPPSLSQLTVTAFLEAWKNTSCCLVKTDGNMYMLLGPVSAYTYFLAHHMKRPSAAPEPGLGSGVRFSPLWDPQASWGVILHPCPGLSAAWW